MKPSNLLWIWIFGEVAKGELFRRSPFRSSCKACYEVVWSLQLVFLNETRSYNDAWIAVMNGCLACICSWLLVIYILYIYMSDEQAAVIYRRHWAQRSYLWWQAKRKFCSRSDESPLFTVESTMNLTIKPSCDRVTNLVKYYLTCVVLTIKFNDNQQSRSQITPLRPVLLPLNRSYFLFSQ